MRVVANKKLDWLTDIIHRYASTIVYMEKNHDDCDNSSDPECLEKWHTKHGVAYPKTWDRLVIASDVCNFLYDDNKGCNFDRDIWN